MKIEKDKILNKWVVWLIEDSLMIEAFHSKNKKDCINFVKSNKKGVHNEKRND